MPEPLPSRYEPTAIDTKLYSVWESKGYFRPKSDAAGKKPTDHRYVIVIPPPNVTGILHMGHALNNTIQDILTRWNRMKGNDTLWIPGVDHAGIATQNVVEKKLAKEKKTRYDLGREKFLEEVWKWKEDHGNTITRQLRRLGASCDWSRERFTMDEGLSKAVREAFVTLYERGLIYQGNRIINWCPRCQTALSDEESEHKDVQGGLYHLKYPVAGKGRQAAQIGVDHIVVATTRPETMLGDVAVAVHPEDERYKHLIGTKVVLPLVEREIPIIGDEFVDREFGTGFVKVTPAHDPNDFEMGQRHNLPQINVMQPDGKINENGGSYQGMDRFVARKKVIADLEEQGLFVKKDTHSHSVGHCYRCATVVEPYLSKQWFVKMKGMAQRALKAHSEGKTVFYPDRWTKVYTNWLEGIRDWCISRQIWWGHRVPAWYCMECYPKIKSYLDPKGGPLEQNEKMPLAHFEIKDRNALGNATPFMSREERPKTCPNGHSHSEMFVQDPDVLDTWFSSWLWPFSTLGWPEKTDDLKHFYPTSDLITAPEIIFFWVARMIMAGLEFLGEVPFSRIYIHGTVRAADGKKMSKSLGNSIDPLEVIDEMGADALRHSMIMLSAQDVFLSREKFEVGRNFTNKIWNASRFVITNLEDKKGTFNLNQNFTGLSQKNFWIIYRLEEIVKKLNEQLSVFNLSQAATELYHFIWNDFCDWYIELAKSNLILNDPQRNDTQQVLFFILEKIMRLLHPFMPFISEEIWQKLKDMACDSPDWPESIMLAEWPIVKERNLNLEIKKEFEFFQQAVSGVRDLRSRLNIPPALFLKAVISAPKTSVLKTIALFEKEIKKLGRLESIFWAENFDKAPGVAGNAFPDFEVFIYVEGVDFGKEKSRIEKEIEQKEKWIKAIEIKLSNENFVKNAPAEVVQAERDKLADAEKVLKANQELLTIFQ